MLAWPFLVWFGLAHDSFHWLLPLIALLLVVRFVHGRRTPGPMRFVMQSIALAGIVLCVASALLKNYQLLLFYPVVMNLVMLTIFGGSLFSSMPLVERLARLREPNLAPRGVRYTRRVTQIWCLFFIVNASVALFTLLHGDISLWTLWNGMIAYLLMGTLMGAEWLVRQRIMTRETL